VLISALAQAKEARDAILANMNACISEARSEVAETAPKIISVTVPLDKVGEIIGPKGKVINTIQQETGADINVDDDGVVGIVTIGSVDGFRVEEAKARILSIIDPPKADVGAVYMGRVVNITKFGAFVNILPGRDGLLHISKLGRGKRINAVEDVLTLGDEIEVRVDEIDDKGKVSLSPAGDPPAEGSGDGGESTERGSERAPRSDRGDRGDRADRGPRRSADSTTSDTVTVSFEDAFDDELRGELGDLGPASEAPAADRPPRRDGGGDRGGRGDRGPRRHR
jgi:polyribonucleotide nucleotidyltransferase